MSCETLSNLLPHHGPSSPGLYLTLPCEPSDILASPTPPPLPPPPFSPLVVLPSKPLLSWIMVPISSLDITPTSESPRSLPLPPFSLSFLSTFSLSLVMVPVCHSLVQYGLVQYRTSHQPAHLLVLTMPSLCLSLSSKFTLIRHPFT